MTINECKEKIKSDFSNWEKSFTGSFYSPCLIDVRYDYGIYKGKYRNFVVTFESERTQHSTHEWLECKYKIYSQRNRRYNVGFYISCEDDKNDPKR